MIEKTLRIIEKVIPKKIYYFFQPYYHFCLALMGNIIYRFPGRKLKIIGITGTNGKTTSAILVGELLKNAGFKVGITTTNFVEINGERKNNATGFTTMGRFKLQKTLKQMVKTKCEWAVIEVTSQGLNQYRLLGIPFDITVFTNLTHEHLDIHKTMERYRDAKAKLFVKLYTSLRKGVPKTIIANTDNKYGKFYLSFKADRKYSFGMEKKKVKGTKGIFATDTKTSLAGTDFKVLSKGISDVFKMGLLGRFNVYNGLVVVSVADVLNIKTDIVKKTLLETKIIDGRMQKIDEGQKFTVFVDYALTPDAVEKLYLSLRELTKGKIIAVFGCAGQRDFLKRPQIGRLASTLTDKVIVTDDEPYKEDPKKIIDQIMEGVDSANKNVIIIRDRRKAIKEALKKANFGDIVIVSGMGHETIRNIGGKFIAWDDREVIRTLLNKVAVK